MKEYLEVANTMKAQMLASQIDGRSGFMVLGSWAAQGFVGMPPREGMRGGALAFRVMGRKHRGFVRVELSFMDTYTVSLLDRNGVVIGEPLEDVYADQLLEVIDGMVETD